MLHPERHGIFNPEIEVVSRLQKRLNNIIRRHVRMDDEKLTDREFIKKVFERWRADADAHHGDPNE